MGVKNIFGNIHIVIGSQLHNYGGGCETWIDYFLEGLLKNKRYNKIYVYHFAPLDSSNCVSTKFEENDDLVFIAMQIKSTKRGAGFGNLFKFSLFSIMRLTKEINDGDTLLCVGSTYVALIGIVLKCLRKGIFLVTWIRSIAVEEMKSRGSRYFRVATLLERNLLRLSDLIVTNGMDTYEYYGEVFPDYASKLVVVENGVNVEDFQAIEPPDFTKDTMDIAYLGRYCDAKGFRFFVKTGSFMGENGSLTKKKLLFHAHGHGELERILGEHIINHGRFLPKDVKHILQSSQIIVFLNDDISAGGVSHGILEALAAGRLIVAWKNRVHCQILNCDNSILVENGRIDQLIDTLIEIANGTHDEVLLSKCQNAVKTAERYSTEQHITRYYEAVLDKKKQMST